MAQHWNNSVKSMCGNYDRKKKIGDPVNIVEIYQGMFSKRIN